MSSTTAVTKSMLNQNVHSDTYILAEEIEPVKVNLSNLTELRNATDDHIKEYFTKQHGFKQDHTFTDIKLLFGYGSCIFACYTAWEGYRTSFEETKIMTIFAVAIYFICSTYITLYSYLLEGDSIFVGLRPLKGDKTLDIATTHPKHSPQLTITFMLATRPKKHSIGGNKRVVEKVTKSFEKWFDEEGYLVPEALNSVLSDGLASVSTKKKQ